MSDLERLQVVYKNRKIKRSFRDRYSVFDPAHLFFRLQRQRAVLNLLKSVGINSLNSLKILEVGCGNGSVLQEFLSFGARSRHLYGVDLLHSRMAIANQQVSQATFLCANGCHLPFSEGSFDIVIQFTALSSVLDPGTRKEIAGEMHRVLKPKGVILWYDFIWNPINPDTCGISKNEILTSFPDCSFIFNRTTLMPPLARKLVVCQTSLLNS